VIVDAHCHAGTGGNRMSGPWDTAAPLDRYLVRADRAGIERSILIPVFHTDYAIANREVGRMAERRPDRFWAFCMVHAARDAGRIRSLVRDAVERFGVRGIKVHRGDAPISREICDAARAFGLPVLYDVFGQPAPIDLFAPAFRDVIFVIPHLGSFGDDWRAHQTVIDQLARHPNVYADTSGVRRFDYLVEAIRRVGPGRLIFGSDGPWLHPGLELAKIRLLGLSSAAEDLITGTTIRAIIGEGPMPNGPGRIDPVPGHHDRRGTRPAGGSDAPPDLPPVGAGALAWSRRAARPLARSSVPRPGRP
jgi:uncharacterized protein